MVTKQKPMPFTKEEVEKIYNTNIIDFAVENGLILEKGDANTVHVKNSGGLYLFKHGRGFHWFTTGKHGNIVEFAMEYFGLSKVEAMESVLGSRAYGSTFTVAEPVKEKTKKMVLPPRDRNNNRAALYLVSDRKLEEDIVYALMDQGRIFQVRQEINGKKYINCAFVGYDQEDTPRYCSLREMKLHGGFRQDVENSDKTYGFLMPGRSKRVYEFEAPIDAISHATLCKRFGIDWTKDYRISEGCLSDRALERFLKNHPEIKEIVFCYDNDSEGHLPDGTPHNHGQVKAEEMKKKYEKLGYWTAIQTPHLKDFNQDLMEYYHFPEQEQEEKKGEEMER